MVKRNFKVRCPLCRKEYFFENEVLKKAAMGKWFENIEYKISFNTEKKSGSFTSPGREIWDFIRMFDLTMTKSIIVKIATIIFPQADFRYFVSLTDSNLINEIKLNSFKYWAVKR